MFLHSLLFHRDILEDFNLDLAIDSMEDNEIHVARANGTYSFPADFMLIAAINPCPCGNYPDMNNCTCTAEQIKRYLGKISGPLLDRIDICIETPKITYDELSNASGTSRSRGWTGSSALREMVLGAVEMQRDRYKGTAIDFNSQLGPGEIDKYIELVLLGINNNGYFITISLKKQKLLIQMT